MVAGVHWLGVVLAVAAFAAWCALAPRRPGGGRGPGARGTGRAGAGRQQGDRPRHRRARWRARGRGSRSRSRSEELADGGRERDRGRGAGLPGRHRRPRADGRAARRGRRGARPGRDPRHATPAGRRRAARSTTRRGVGGRLPLAGAGPAVLVEAVLPGMRERGWGRIVNVASTSVREPIRGLALSNANRMAAVGLFKTLADEVAADGDHASTRSPPGMFATDRLAACTARSRRAEEAPGSRCRRAGSARPRSTATWSPSSARSAPPT